MSGSNGYVQFIDDDEGYLRWLAQNPGGYVVNSHRSPAAWYLILHRASCRWINTGAKNNWTTTGYIKTCSTSVPPLEAWAEQATSGRLKPCGACRPEPSAEAASSSSPRMAAAEQPSSLPRPTAAPEPPAFAAGTRTVPPTISTGCLDLDRAWASYASMILHRSHILIPDTDDDLTWHAYLGHSIDMQGFRAAEFAGVDPLTRKAPGFVPLKARGIGVPELATLWEIDPIRRHLMARIDRLPLDATLEVLRTHGGAVGSSLAEAFRHFPWRKFHRSVRALLQNSAELKPMNFSFRRWLVHECHRLDVGSFPPDDFRQTVTLEEARMTLGRALRARLQRTFYMVEPAMSAYMLCDWQLWLWREGRTAVFADFKLDSFHEAFVKKFGRGVIPADEAGFARWWLGLFPDLPPRLANECIWLAVENKQVDPW
jgi:hypothetical protein